jgi:hypothetical protein
LPGPSCARLSKVLALRRHRSGSSQTCSWASPSSQVQTVASDCSVAGDVAYSLPSRSWIRPTRR